MAMTRRAAMTAAAACAILIGTATAAVASVPSANGTIDACRSSLLGTVRVVDTDAGQRCRAGEVALSWNQRGPAGAPGQRGPSDVYSARQQGELLVDVAGGDPLSLKVPAGSYSIAAKLTASHAGSTNPVGVICFLHGWSGYDAASTTVNVDIFRSTIPLMWTETFDVERTVFLRCATSNGVGPYRVSGASIVATRTDALHG